jgi:hypothetical protein
MGLIKFICSKFTCKSTCSYNNEIFDSSHLSVPLEQFNLKMKDVKKILKILNKRDKIDVIDELGTLV